MTAPTALDAKNRAPVDLADGRTGWLLYWPVPVEARHTRPGHGKGGQRARVYLDTGHVLSINPDHVTLQETAA
jgi:hypothetical protein